LTAFFSFLDSRGAAVPHRTNDPCHAADGAVAAAVATRVPITQFDEKCVLPIFWQKCGKLTPTKYKNIPNVIFNHFPGDMGARESLPAVRKAKTPFLCLFQGVWPGPPRHREIQRFHLDRQKRSGMKVSTWHQGTPSKSDPEPLFFSSKNNI
jgi:hypothetical protein